MRKIVFKFQKDDSERLIEAAVQNSRKRGLSLKKLGNTHILETPRYFSDHQLRQFLKSFIQKQHGDPASLQLWKLA